MSGPAVDRFDKGQYRSGMMHKKRVVEASVLDLARERIREACKLFDTLIVSFSGGKDSTVVLNLALEAAAERGQDKLVVCFYDEECIPLETVAYVSRVRDRADIDMRWACLPIKHRNGCSRSSPFWYPWAPEVRDLWVRPLPDWGITADQVPGFPAEIDRRPSMPDCIGLLFRAKDYGRVGMLMGIRAQESVTRTRAVLMRTRDSRNYIKPWAGTFSDGNLHKVYPIYDWLTEDVWTAPATLGWDYNTAYDVMEKLGIAHNQQRVGPPFGEEPMQDLYMFAEAFPDIWDGMSRRVPGAATAARYSRTELYSFRGYPEKPAEMTWPEFIRHWIEKHPKGYQPSLAKRVRWLIRDHFRKTTEPMAVKAPHPHTGYCWNFILKIVVRGDYKHRKTPAYVNNVETARQRYAAEIAEMRDTGQLAKSR